ncbi:MAG TPA: nucleoside triphosphate pyrophosphohydrolase [Patescibacteria group bacterium]|nr:nucleoside triphosphate pyrophosphohydrolase [Patescibacteria group bacterium]
MYQFKVAKLVRDKIAQRMIANENASYRVLNDKDFISQLKKKILEEAKELIPVKDKEKIIKEIADLQEIIDTLIKTLKSSKKEIKTKQREENKKSSSFRKRLYIEKIELENNHQWLDYYLSHPKKYPKIKNK